MLFNQVYYQLKPLLPWTLRTKIRRWAAWRKRPNYQSCWPISPSAAPAPAGWPGWPEGKRFALVLTHDVEGEEGVGLCRPLMALEKEFGFRSSFNFVPELYTTPKELREELAAQGFEVGLHGLKHDGKLYRSREIFRERAQRINFYLQDWKAVGFRSPFMHHNLEWLHDLDVKYDASTFDTDPFEPQSDGTNTIFPFWVPGVNGRPGYVELPYTLAQDSTLFVLFQEKNIETWKRKLDWVVSHGGMVLVDVHPDYVDFKGNGAVDGSSYPAAFYRELLQYVRSKYEGQFWHALPREVAEFVAEHQKKPKTTSHFSQAVQWPWHEPRVLGRKIWIDLDNTPHVPFFEPIIEELEKRGHTVLLTARDAFQVCDLAAKKGMKHLTVGRHHGKNPLLKVTGLFYRAAQLSSPVCREKPALAVSHGSRSQIILSNALGIPSVLLADYEFAKMLPLMRPTWEMVPEVVPSDSLYCPPEKIRKYPGIKEDVYVAKLQPDARLLTELGLSADELIVTARPPATEAHYHNPESEGLFVRFMDRACRTNKVRVVLLPRNKKQGELMRQTSPHWFENNKTVIPKGAVDGLNLLWHSDLVVSGGGTMNREAAALGVPVYSIFRGKTGAVDHHLEKEGKLRMITNGEEVDQKILLTRRPRKSLAELSSPPALTKIVDHLEEILKIHYGA